MSMSLLEFVFDMFMCKHEGKNLLELSEEDMFELRYWINKEENEKEVV